MVTPTSRGRRGPSWVELARSVPVAQVAAAAGLGAGRSNSLAPCPACGAEQRGSTPPDRRGPVGTTRDGFGWRCHRCGAGGDGIALVALAVSGALDAGGCWAQVGEFYERAGRVKGLAGMDGSVTVIGAVSPPGGDFSEPVTQNTLRIVKVFWALDSKLAQRRHFPAIHWLTSYSLYNEGLGEWFGNNVAPDFNDLRGRAMEILQKESELQEIVQLIGSDALPVEEQLTLEVARMIREFWLQQNAFHAVDTYCPMELQYKYLKVLLDYSDKAFAALEAGATVEQITGLDCLVTLSRAKFEEDFGDIMDKVSGEITEAFATMGGGS